MTVGTFSTRRIDGDQELIDALKALGNIVRFTVLPGRDHDILDVYENQELYSWHANG